MKQLALIGLVLAALAAPSVAASTSPVPSKAQARQAAVRQMNRYLRAHAWLRSGAIGKCSRISMHRVDCRITFRGASRTCVAVARIKAQKATLGSPRCRNARPVSKVARLSAHLSDSPLRNLLDPFKATYGYSASSGVEAKGAVEAEPRPGVLALYVDGVLECAENVNEANPEAECPVKHDELGTYRVTTIYTAGNESATDSMLYKLEPIPTSTSLSVSYEPLAVARYMASGCAASTCTIEDGFFDNADMMIGTLTVTIGAVSPWGSAAVTTCPFGLTGCASLPEGEPRTMNLPVHALADLIVHGDQDLVEGQPVDAEMQPPSSIELPDLSISQQPVSAIEAGSRFFLASSGPRAGYSPSEAKAPIQFIPQATPTIVFR